MFDVLEAVLARAGRGVAVEAYGEEVVSRRVKVYGGEVEQFTAARRRGVGVRVFRDGAMGFAHTSDLSPHGLAEVVERALACAAASDPDPFAGLPEAAGEPAPVQPFDARLAAVDDARRIDFARELEAAALAADPRVRTVEDALYADADAGLFLLNSAGVRRSCRVTQCSCYVYVLAEQDGQVETGHSFALGRTIEDMDPVAVAREGAARACRLLGARKCASMKVPVVLDPFVAAAVVRVVAATLTADAVQKGRSLFAGREGQRVASEVLSLVDDATLPDGPESVPFDGEGVPTRRTPLIEDGVLRGFLYDTYTARRAGRTSTGNGFRASHASVPGVRPSNLVVGGPATPAAGLVAGLDRGVLVCDVVGVHSGANPVSGQFSVGMSGVLVERGELTRPVREVTLAGDLLGMLAGVRALGDDARWVPEGSVLTPSLLVEGMAVGGD